MSLRIGSTLVNDIRIGATPVQRIAVGSTVVWARSGAALREDFTQLADTTSLVTTGRWSDEVHDNASNLAGVVNGSCQINIPDGIVAVGYRTSRMRYTAATLGGDDGYIECEITSQGDSIDSNTYLTQVLRRVSNTGFTDGVGLQLDASAIRIVRRVASVDTPISTVGSYAVGDVIRLVQTGDLHDVYKNGDFLGEWNDSTHTAHRGSAYRSMGLCVSGAKPAFFIYPVGPRRFSPGIAYCEAA